MTSEVPDLCPADGVDCTRTAGFRGARLVGLRSVVFLADSRTVLFLVAFAVAFLADLGVVFPVALRVNFFLVDLRAAAFADFRAVCFFCFVIEPTGCFSM